ncbi:vanadium-dependent haloperoxidase [Ginsengibacter hankyongi]|uniref:Vanadium-dependent haloperoxidase n=1 Tax=Ginsengibacter hankyongi TaxID=2607284 RepID=A0A5J5IIW7_9BACT|nr:vanadium-dependent haloperoxidase [Ginsengibacter hankyongi]KAA9038179.1 vanadium-dependent haloperoxidase [Ginsengibacter hankyongi]
MRKFLLFSCSVIILWGCNSKKDYVAVFNNPILFCKTVYQLNGVVMGNNFSPIVASRNYLYASIAAYEVIAAGYPEKYQSLAGQLNGLKSMPRPGEGKKINFEFASLLAYCNLGSSVTFPEGSMDEYVDSLKKLATDHGMPTDVFNNSVAFSDTISHAILNWSKKDNYAQTRSAEKYSVTDEPGRWVPTPPAYASAMEPHWNQIRTLVMDSATEFVPPPPYPFNVKDSNSDYYKQVMLIKNAIENLTPEQKHIADFWDDNPFKLNVSGHVMFGSKKFSPPGHWMSIVGIAAEKSKADFPTTVYAYAKTSIALFDAFIQCWDEKYRHNTVRPETVINKYFDAGWQPYLQTPPFPEYTCGHSTCSSAAAEVLTSVFGDNFSYTDSTELEFGIKNRSYKSFRDAAEENNWARFYGGIHFHHSCIVSTEYGKKVGELVVNRLKMKKG